MIHEPEFDILLKGGRVMDPETGRDEVTDLAIRNGKIAAIGPVAGTARQVIDASGLIVAPGFIDLHAHGQCLPADRMQAFDGVTTTLELEMGTLPVARWYDEQARDGRLLNYGTAASWLHARSAVFLGVDIDTITEEEFAALGAADRRWSLDVASAEQVEQIVAMLRRGVEEGGIGMGILNAYMPGSGVKEMTEICDLAAETGTPTFTHVAYMSNEDPQSSIEAYIRIIGYAAATGAHMHICHLNSTSMLDAERAAELIGKAQAAGLPITVEAYPYGTGSTYVSAAFLVDPNYPRRMGRDYDSLQKVVGGHRFTDRDDLMATAAENPGELVLIHFLEPDRRPRDQELLDASVLYPGGAIASDAMPWMMGDSTVYKGHDWPLPEEAVAHPRSSGTFTRFLRQWARERRALPLMDAIEKCTLIPARIIESCAPAMRGKGRLQPGMDADIVVFDFDTVGEQASFEHMNRPAQGMHYVFVNGTAVIADGTLDLAATPGRAVRRQA